MIRVIQSDDRDLWDQQEEEPKLWFERFDLYRLLGPARSISKAYRKWRLVHKGIVSTSGHAEQFWYDHAKEWKWEDRSNAWDDAVREETEEAARTIVNSGLSLSHERIRRLSLVAKKLEDFILDDKTTRISPYVIEQYRGILDDIAKERGERQKETRITGPTGGAILIETSWGRGNAANERWKGLEAPKSDTVIEAVVEEVTSKDD
jgi:hypothetical protein